MRLTQFEHNLSFSADVGSGTPLVLTLVVSTRVSFFFYLASSRLPCLQTSCNAQLYHHDMTSNIRTRFSILASPHDLWLVLTTRGKCHLIGFSFIFLLYSCGAFLSCTTSTLLKFVISVIRIDHRLACTRDLYSAWLKRRVRRHSYIHTNEIHHLCNHLRWTTGHWHRYTHIHLLKCFGCQSFLG